jgi:hypothetical protein
MKTKFFLLIIFALYATIVSAQSNPNEYRNLAAMHIWMSNCDKAKKCYDIYKDLSGKSLDKMDILIAETCGGKKLDGYTIIFDKDALLSYLRKTDFVDKDLLLRVLSMYNDPKEMGIQLRNCEKVYEPIARQLEGAAWYESIIVQKKL